MVRLLLVAGYLVSLFILAVGCSSHSQPLDGEEPQLTGPGRINGSFDFFLPTLWIADRAAPEQPSLRASIGLFFPSSTEPVRECAASLYQGPGDSPAHWRQSFDFQNVPLGDYEIRLYSRSFVDWGIYDYHEYWCSTLVVLTADAPEDGSFAAIYQSKNYGEKGAIAGTQLLDGNDVSQVWFWLPEDLSEFNLLYWKATVGDLTFGRIGYRFADLALREYDFGYGNEAGSRLDETHTPVEDAPVVLTAEAPVVEGVDFISPPWLWGSTNIPPEIIAFEMGLVDVTLTVDGTWEGDLVLVLEMQGGMGLAVQRGHFFVLPSQVQAGHWQKQLMYFDPSGSYTLTAYLLGDTPADVQQVYAHPTQITLVAPPWQPSDPPSLFEYPPPPQAEVAIVLDFLVP